MTQCKCSKSKAVALAGPAESFEPGGSSREIRNGAALYERFNRFGPAKLIRVRHARLMPPVVVDLGQLVGLIYRSAKGTPGTPRTYIHFMQTPAHLVCNALGTQLYVVGGRYRISPQGIEG